MQQQLTDNQIHYHYRRVFTQGADNQAQEELINDAMALSRALQRSFPEIVYHPIFREEFAKTVRLRRVK